MTKEEKISSLKNILSEINESDDAVCYLTSEDKDLIESAIKALEQEPKFILKSDGTIERIKNYDVLNKIRAEIKELATYDNVDTLVDVVRIIDKYAGGKESNE